ISDHYFPQKPPSKPKPRPQQRQDAVREPVDIMASDEVKGAIFEQPSEIEELSADGVLSPDDYVSSVGSNDVELSDDFFQSVSDLRLDIDTVKDDVSSLKSLALSEISDSLFPKGGSIKDKGGESLDGLDSDSFQENLNLTNEFFDKVSTLAEKIRTDSLTENMDQALSKMVAEEDEGETLSNFELNRKMAENIERIAESIEKVLPEAPPEPEHDEFSQDLSSMNQDFDLISKRNESLEKELDTFKDLVDMLKEEKEQRKETEKSLEDFEKSLDEIKQQLAKEQKEKEKEKEYPPEEPEEPLEVFKANEEVLKKKVKKKIPSKDDEMQYYPDLVEYDEPEENFQELDEVLGEDLSHAEVYTRDDALKDDSKENYHNEIDPAFIPTPYSTDHDYKNDDGFFQDITGEPVMVEQKIITKEKIIEKVSEASSKEETPQEKPMDDSEPTESPELKTETQTISTTETSSGGQPAITVQAELQEKAPPPRPKRSLRQPIRLTFDFRNMFNNKYYRKYKDMLNEAATLVAEKKLDEALEYYYVIQDQNIPQSFKIMIKQNIKDIEETIADTFRYSDTIVKVDDAGDVSRVRIEEEEEYEEEDYEIENGNMVVSQELAFKEDD
ncbi:MAG: hypothetical protein OEZ36_11655, partial [Spirochaetota bacterium]|nr:hypothetical protein [Spirochaetota bacterium]